MSARSPQQQRLSPPSPSLPKRSSKLSKADLSDFHEIPSMNDLINGLAKAGPANSGVARCRRTKKKTLSNGSPPAGAGNGIITLSDSSRSSDPNEDSRSNFTSESDSITFEECTGIMKRVVDEWEIPRKVPHSSIDNVKPIVYALAASLAVIVPTDVLRLRSRRFEKLYEKAVGFLMSFGWRHIRPDDTSWPLPRKLLNPPLAPRKSFAGFAAAVLTGAVVAIGFWGWAAPKWQGYSVEPLTRGAVSWKWDEQPGVGVISGGWTSLALVGAVTGLVSGVAEALDLGKVDDNLSLPIISGTVLWGLSELESFFMGNGF